jgi:hypothetical protein
MIAVLLLLLLDTAWPAAGSPGAALRCVMGGKGGGAVFIETATTAADMRTSAAVLPTGIPKR